MSRWSAIVLSAVLALGILVERQGAFAADLPEQPTYSDQVILFMAGMIGRGAYHRFRRAVVEAEPTIVVLEGPGGYLGESILIGEEVRKRGLATVVLPNGKCASACAVVFLSGRAKYMGRNAYVGLHAASSEDGRASASGTGIMAGYLRDLGVPRAIIRRMTETSPRDIRWLTRSDRRALRIQTLGTAR
jgi:hypothetical protein